jgi:xanthine dehydrogenase accessory factor
MVVARGAIAHGTIGGGELERLALEEARALLADPGAGSRSLEVPLAEAAGQCCGGHVTLFLEPLRWRRNTIAIFGAGHVGQALAGLAPWLRARVLLVDGRAEEELHPRPPRERAYELVLSGAPEAELDGLPADALVVVMTHDHALDLELVARALSRGFRWVGLIGSARKRERFEKRLLQRGFTPQTLARLRCPIGATRTSKEPSAIALSAAAELATLLDSPVSPRP